MKIDQRLRLLRGDASEVSPANANGDLAQRLRRLAPVARHQEARKAPDEQALADYLGAERLAPGVLCVERRFGIDASHGRARPGDCLATLADLTGEPPGRPSGWLFLDTETSGLSGGTGTWAFLCGLLRFEGQGLLLRQYLLARLDAERKYLEAVEAELRTAELLITYNGKSFDGPLLTTRLRLASLSTTLEGKRHLDLLHPTRRAFARVWQDCRLATAERRLLRFFREDDLPGAQAPAAWLAWLQQGDIATLAGVLDHNHRDLLSLPALAGALARVLRQPGETGADVAAVARHWLSVGDEATALSVLVQGRGDLDEAGLLDLARLHRRRSEWAQAHGIWRSLAEQGHPRGIDALTKYLEHRAKDCAKALEWTDRLPAGPDRECRRRRLRGKLNARTACFSPLAQN